MSDQIEKAAAELVETDREKPARSGQQDPVLIIDKTGIHAVIDGVSVRFDDGRGLRGRALQCLMADLERN